MCITFLTCTGHFRAASVPSVSKRVCAKPFISTCVPHTGAHSCKANSFFLWKFCTRTRFEIEAQCMWELVLKLRRSASGNSFWHWVAVYMWSGLFAVCVSESAAKSILQITKNNDLLNKTVKKDSKLTFSSINIFIKKKHHKNTITTGVNRVTARKESHHWVAKWYGKILLSVTHIF